MDCQAIMDNYKDGLRVRVAKLGTTMGIFAHNRHLATRFVGATGKVLCWVPGHGGDVWAILHDIDGFLAVYSFTELEEMPKPYPPLPEYRKTAA